MASNMSSYSLLGLRCGTIYQFFMEAINEFGVGERTETVTSATQGTPPIAPLSSMMVVNSTSIDLHLASWGSGGCDISSFVIEYRKQHKASTTIKGHKDWILVNNNVRPSDFNTENRKFSVLDLRPSTKYVLRITAHNSAGSTVKEYAFITLNDGGKKVSTEGLLVKDSTNSPIYDISIPVLVFFIPLAGFIAIGALLCVKRRDLKQGLNAIVVKFSPRSRTSNTSCEINELDLTARMTTPRVAVTRLRCNNDYELSEDEDFDLSYGFNSNFGGHNPPLDTLTNKSNLNSPALFPRKINEPVNYIHRDAIALKSHENTNMSSLHRGGRAGGHPQERYHYVMENHYSTIHWNHPHHHVSRPRTHSIHN